jgi:uncharacterized oligopeptide transporter (OPT) family protein
MNVPSGPLEPSALEGASEQPAAPVLVQEVVAAGGELTPRALIGGCLIGAGLAVSNIYMGLKTGLWESGSIMAAVLGFSGLSALGRRWGGAPGRLETNLTQTAASAAGAMPAAAGLLGTLPALALMGISVPAWSLVAWGAALGLLGVLASHLLRRRVLVDEALPFPTGVATAEVITAMHQGGQVRQPGRARALVGAGLFSMALTWLRDVFTWVPGLTALPGRLAGLPAATFTWGIGWMPMALGIGLMAGLPMGLSMLLGAVLAWGVLAPALVGSEVVAASGGYDALAGWLIWPGVGLMVGAALVSLGAQARSLLGAMKDLRSLGSGGEGPSRWVLATALGAGGVVLVLGVGVFGLSLLHTLVMLALVVPLCAVCARGAGQMDVAPVGQMGQIAQAASGALFPGPAGLNIAASSVVAGAVSQTGVSLWSLKAGHLLGAAPQRQLLAQMLGVLVGAVVAVPAYLLLVQTHAVGSEVFPVPSAQQFRVVAELATQGFSGLPPYAAQAAGIGFGVGAALTLAARGRLERFLPSPVAMGIGFILPAYFAVTIALGGLLAMLARRVRPQWTAQYLPAVGAGTIAGESLMGLAIAALTGLGLLQR